MSWLKQAFTGSTFWLINAIGNLVLAAIGMVTDNDTTLPLLVMWVSLATYEILKQLESRNVQE